MDAALRRRLRTVSVHGLASAAGALAGDDLEAVCATLRTWSAQGQGELPWLAGPGLSAVRRAGAAVPFDEDLKVIERFLVGAQADAHIVEAAVDRCAEHAGDPGPALPPDAGGALAEAVEHFFELLTGAYAQLHAPVRGAHRRDADQVLAQWRPRLDEAGDEAQERAKVLTGERPVATARRKPARGSRDRPGCAIAFVGAALLTAAVMVWAVLHGWPAQPVDLPF